LSLREFQISAAYRRFADEEDDQVIDKITRAAEPTTSVTVEAKTDSHEDSIIWKVGHGSVWLGTAILSVPDPIPYVDEMVGVGLVAGGAALMYSQQR
jgi:hypothetical protein